MLSALGRGLSAPVPLGPHDFFGCGLQRMAADLQDIDTGAPAVFFPH